MESVLAGLLAMWHLAGPNQASAETVVSADLSAGINVSNNPYLLDEAGNTNSVSATVTVAPVVKFLEASGNFRLSGSVRHEEFFNRYKSNQSFSLDAYMNRRLSSQLSFHGGVGFDSAIIGANELLSGVIGDGGIVDPTLPPIVDDITLNGLRQRRKSFTASGGFAYQASALDQISLDYSAALNRYPNSTASVGNGSSDYDYYGQTLGYSRTLNSRASIGANINVARTNYRGTSLGDALIISPQLTGSLKVAERWSLSGSIGTTITRLNSIGGKTNNTSLAGSLSACRSGERDNLCLSASRSAAPTAFNGVRTQTTFGASYSYRVDERSDISASANYSRASEPFTGVSQALEYASANVSINRRINQRLSAFISGGYSDSFEKISERRANMQVSAGIRFLVGDRR